MSRPRALLSVSDKRGIARFGRALVERGWQILSTGGTARTLREAEIPVTAVEEVTGHPEMMEGRVKTLHPAIHAGILARRARPGDLEALEERGYGPIDLVAVNLYPFRERVARGGVPAAEAMEEVDIGGPTLIRAAAKNHRDVWPVADPADYGRVIAALDGEGDPEALRRELAAKVFGHVSGYDGAIASYLEDGEGRRLGKEVGTDARRSPAGGPEPAQAEAAAAAEALPSSLTLELERLRTLRYGENPDQEGAFYGFAGIRAGLASLDQRHGKDLSYNNFLDLDGALLALAPFAFSPRPAVAIVKHTTPCGLAVGESLEEGYRRALATDPMSAFGSVIAVNRPVDPATAQAMSELFIECVVAPGYEEEAFGVLARKEAIRLLAYPGVEEPTDLDPAGDAWWDTADPRVRATARFLAAHSRFPRPRTLRSVYGGVLAQSPPRPPFFREEAAVEGWRVATKRAPEPDEWRDLRFAWAAVFSVKSNSILLARDGATVGIGAGQMSRVDASKVAVRKAGEAGLEIAGSVLASDAFFPFRDGVDAAAEEGVRAIVQPGGSIRDEEVIEAADEHGIAMVLTGRRVFRH